MGGEHVHSMDIHLSAIDDIRTFVNLANRYPFYIALRQGRAQVDAKSLLGVLSLDNSKPITVEIYTGDASEMMEALETYAR